MERAEPMAGRPKGAKNAKTLEQEAAEKRKKTRPCLQCKRPFRSEGFHNRFCWECREEIAKEYKPPTGKVNDDLSRE